MKLYPASGADSATDPVITTREAARLLGVAVSTAQLWMESGAIASWKTPGGHRRCLSSAVHQWMEKGSDRSVAPQVQLDREFLAAPRAPYPTLACEPQRLAALSASRLIDSAPEPAWDRITWLATQVTQCPMALISLLTSERQWFKARTGLDATETPRDWAFCSHAIMHEQGLVVEDALQDARFVSNPLVVGAPFIRFYAGLPIRDRQAQRLGTLCVLDTAPRQLSDQQLRGLRELAQIVSEEIARRE